MNDEQPIMKLEFLPNEIFFEYFEYLNAFDIFYSFDQLNSRFNNLICHIPLFIDIENVNKSIFDKFCTKMLLNPRIKDQVYSIKFPDEYKCLRSNIFLSLFPLHEFIYLRKFESMLSLLPPSESSRETDETSSYIKIKLDDLLQRNLQTLSILEIDWPIQPVAHTSIINLTIHWCSAMELYPFLSYVPMLRYLHVKHIFSSSQNTDISFYEQYGLHLKQMIIDEYDDDLNFFEKFLTQTPNLKSLTISTLNNHDMLNTYRWENLITSLLSSLDIFKFNFVYSCSKKEPKNFIDKFKQFQTDFWQHQNHWYSEYIISDLYAYIYTIPYISNKYHLCPHDIKYSNNLINHDDTFVNVTDLTLGKKILENSQYYFSNVTSLKLTSESYIFLTTKLMKYLKTTMNLFNLRHLDMTEMSDKTHLSVLLRILKEAPKLSSITIKSYVLKEFMNNKEICKYLNKMITTLKVDCSDCLFGDSDFEAKHVCEIFTNIEHLECAINWENDLLVLINHLPKLCSLKASSQTCMKPGSYLSRFEKKARKLNIIYDIKCRHIVSKDYWGGFIETIYDVVVFIWLGKKNIT